MKITSKKKGSPKPSNNNRSERAPCASCPACLLHLRIDSCLRSLLPPIYFLEGGRERDNQDPNLGQRLDRISSRRRRPWLAITSFSSSLSSRLPSRWSSPPLRYPTLVALLANPLSVAPLRDPSVCCHRDREMPPPSSMAHRTATCGISKRTRFSPQLSSLFLCGPTCCCVPPSSNDSSS